MGCVLSRKREDIVDKGEEKNGEKRDTRLHRWGLVGLATQRYRATAVRVRWQSFTTVGPVFVEYLLLCMLRVPARVSKF